MKCEIQDGRAALVVALCGGACDLNQAVNDVLLLGIGCVLAQPQSKLKELGEVAAIEYISKKDNTLYRHNFHKKPKLCSSLTQLFLVGGLYNFREGLGICERGDFGKNLQHPTRPKI